MLPTLPKIKQKEAEPCMLHSQGHAWPSSPWAVILSETNAHRLIEKILAGPKSVLSNGACVLLVIGK